MPTYSPLTTLPNLEYKAWYSTRRYCLIDLIIYISMDRRASAWCPALSFMWSNIGVHALSHVWEFLFLSALPPVLVPPSSPPPLPFSFSLTFSFRHKYMHTKSKAKESKAKSQPTKIQTKISLKICFLWFPLNWVWRWRPGAIHLQNGFCSCNEFS